MTTPNRPEMPGDFLPLISSKTASEPHPVLVLAIVLAAIFFTASLGFLALAAGIWLIR